MTAVGLGGLSGLSEKDARARLEDEVPNELPAKKKRNLLATGLELARQPMLIMLVAAGNVYLAITLTVPFAQRIGNVAPLHLVDLIFSLGAGLLRVLWFELLKMA